MANAKPVRQCVSRIRRMVIPQIPPSLLVGYLIIGLLSAPHDLQARNRLVKVDCTVMDSCYNTITSCARDCQAGDTVLVYPNSSDSIGEYTEVTEWPVSNLVVRGLGPRRIIINANGQGAGGKAAWYASATNFTAENFEFKNASVPDLNGAGIRMDIRNGRLTVRNCYFHDNENGILAGSSNDAQNLMDSILIENSIFDHNGRGDGQ